MDIRKEYDRWLENATSDADIVEELKAMNDAKIEDAFYRDLAFGTGGLRGVIGAGTNRMNIYTVSKASQGLADYLKKNFAEPSVVIGYDSRIKSDMEYAKKCNADLLLATDPDCDRVGIAVKNKAGEYELLTGNQTGMLLLDYICSQRVKHGKMPADPVMIKTIVTMDMGEQIASHYALRTINVLTGFKFIGEQIGKLEQQGKL